MKYIIDHWGKTERLETQTFFSPMSWDGTVTSQIAPNVSVTAQVVRLPLGHWASHSSWSRDKGKYKVDSEMEKCGHSGHSIPWASLSSFPMRI